ncbi:right-handed parallel beta-helix repeat-containing protein [Mycolicibacterium sp. CBMA 226]|uniref:right-handed parallel beta-helix repeat-containing protein n=1 Tax=Mycolicibacterium sp. CBMA 226 TaxID=2606611 RepID=UPI0012DF53F7|nr:right-handed parallel beta-helix repeat-containing protein [Mycolicibacterium sp. CBMA 226]MUL78124.1 glycoside hydrolase [Mycolicibacterium sp. CBMA 226]
MRARTLLAAAVAVTMLGVGCKPQSAADTSTLDDTAALQAQFDALTPGSTLTLEPRVYHHSGILTIRTSAVTIDGNGSTLVATDDATSAVNVLANNVSLNNMTLGANLIGPRYYGIQQHKLVIGGNNDSVSNVTINGSAGAGVYVNGAGWFNLSGITVNSSRADGIHMTNGSHDGIVTDSVTTNTGDDGFAVVSYIPDGKICNNITVNNPVVNGTTWGRGISVVGGQNITYNNIKVSNTNAAGVYVAAEPSYNTRGVNGVTVNGGTVTGASSNPDHEHGAILVYAGNPGQTIDNVTIENLSISGTGSAAEREIGLILENGGSTSNVNFTDLNIEKSSLPTLYTNAPESGYAMRRVLVGGVPAQN